MINPARSAITFEHHSTELAAQPAWQGRPQRDETTLSMIATMRNKLFGSRTNHGDCEAVCPKKTPIEFIGKLNRDAHEQFHDGNRQSQEFAPRQLQDIPVQWPEHVETSRWPASTVFALREKIK